MDAMTREAFIRADAFSPEPASPQEGLFDIDDSRAYSNHSPFPDDEADLFWQVVELGKDDEGLWGIAG